MLCLSDSSHLHDGFILLWGIHREIVLNSFTLQEPREGVSKLLTAGAGFSEPEAFALWPENLSVCSHSPCLSHSPETDRLAASVDEVKAFKNSLNTKNCLRQLSLGICKKTGLLISVSALL